MFVPSGSLPSSQRSPFGLRLPTRMGQSRPFPKSGHYAQGFIPSAATAAANSSSAGCGCKLGAPESPVLPGGGVASILARVAARRRRRRGSQAGA
jgi:hypothetical protein